MNNHDFTKLSKKALFNQFEQERQEWLAEGMSEADIFKIHFGELDENGKLIKPKNGSYGGDYLIWLSERKHTRPDHKYSPGTPFAIDAVDPDGAWISGGRSGIDDADFKIDLENSLSKLTELQRACFVEVKLESKTQADVAAELGVSRESVKQAIAGALKKLRNIFS